MKLKSSLLVISIALSLTLANAQTAKYDQAKPLSQVVNKQAKPVSNSGTVKVPLITWGGDVATILGDMDGIFKANGLNVNFFREDDFKSKYKCV